MTYLLNIYFQSVIRNMKRIAAFEFCAKVGSLRHLINLYEITFNGVLTHFYSFLSATFQKCLIFAILFFVFV